MTGRPTFDLRPEEPTDADQIRQLNDAAFGGPTESGIVDRMRGSDDWLAGGSIVAVDSTRNVVGHVLLSRGRLTNADGREWQIGMIGPVAVAPPLQGRGIGGALMRAAIARAGELGLPLICLLGHPTYYPRFGFEPARPLGIEPPQPWTDDVWMALRLPGWTPGMSGVANYGPAFNAE